MTAKDNNFIPPTEWLFAPKQPRSTKRRGDADRGDAAPPTKRAKAASDSKPDKLIKDLARLTYERIQLTTQVKALTAQLNKTEMNLLNEEDRSMLLLLTACFCFCVFTV